MRRLMLLFSALVAVVAFGATVSTAAFALVVQLPSEATARNFTGKSDGTENPKFETTKKTSVVCTSSPGKGTEEANGKPLGEFTIEFKGCKGHESGLEAPCKGLGQAAETIVVTGTWHLWYDSLSPSLGVATVFLLNEVHFECTFIVTKLYKVKGNVVCLDLEPTVSMKNHLFHCLQKEGVAEEKTYWNESGAEQKAQLLQSLNGGAFEESAELALGVVEASVATSADNV
jgi:hypothetical protein